MGVTSIQWTDRSANPIRVQHRKTGKVGWHCVKTSPGCSACYSEAINRRFGTGLPFSRRSTEDVEVFFDTRPMEAILKLRKKGQKIFLCDMTDLFGDFVADSFIDLAFTYMAMAKDQVFQVLTKRIDRAAHYFREADHPFSAPRSVPPNVWIGCSVEDQQRADERIPELLKIPATVRFLSVEPLLGPINLGLWRVDIPKHRESWPTERVRNFWTIIGGESGPKARPCDMAWIRSIVEQCREAGVPAFVKQMGAYPVDDSVHGERKTTVVLRDSKGGDWDEWPEDLRIREFPEPAR